MELEQVKEQQYFNLRQVSSEYAPDYTIAPYLAKVLPQDKSAKILDIGCGMGQMLHALRVLGYENVYGVDISDEAVEHCRALGLNVEKVIDLGS